MSSARDFQAQPRTSSSHLCEVHSSLLLGQTRVFHEEAVLAMNGQEMLWLHKAQHLLELTLQRSAHINAVNCSQ